MSQYFDKDFFRFFWGFLAIVFVSLTIILFVRIYEERLAGESQNTASVVEVIIP